MIFLFFFLLAVFCLIMLARAETIAAQILCGFWAVLATIVATQVSSNDDAVKNGKQSR